MLDDSQKRLDAELMTIGYEGANIGDFVATLVHAGVGTLVDVRELPLSRKKGFSKNALRQAVESAGISYIHLRELGDPKPGRDAARSGQTEKFRKIFSQHLETDAAQNALQELVPVAIEGGACLLCFERSHTHCHRSMVADEIERKVNISIKHIGVRHGIAGEPSS